MLSISYSWDLLCIRPLTYLSQGSDSTWQNASADPQLLPNLAEHLQLLDSWKSHPVEVVWLSNPPVGTDPSVSDHPGHAGPSQIWEACSSWSVFISRYYHRYHRPRLPHSCPGLQIHHLGPNDPSRKHPCPCSISLDVSKDHQKK